ncbi:MAG: methyltransferase domain-containing protein [Pseudomonadota bacterium]
MLATVSKFLAKQYAQPSGFFGRWLMGRHLDQINAAGNALVLQALCPKPHERIVEVGFGGGDLLLEIANCAQQAIGIERSTSMLDRAHVRINNENYDNVSLHSGSAESIPVDDETADAVISVNTIYFWPSMQSGLREIIRVLKRDGRLVLGFGSKEHLQEAGYDQRGFSLYSEKEVEQLAREAGFDECVLHSIERGKRGPFFALICRRTT